VARKHFFASLSHGSGLGGELLYGTRAFGWRTDPPAYRAKQVRCTTHQPTRPLEAKRRLELLLVSYGRSTTAHASSGTMISW